MPGRARTCFWHARHAPACRPGMPWHARHAPAACPGGMPRACRHAPACPGMLPACFWHASGIPGMPGAAGMPRHASGMLPACFWHAPACPGMLLACFRHARHAGACRHASGMLPACFWHASGMPDMPGLVKHLIRLLLFERALDLTLVRVISLFDCLPCHWLQKAHHLKSRCGAHKLFWSSKGYSHKHIEHHVLNQFVNPTDMFTRDLQ